MEDNTWRKLFETQCNSRHFGDLVHPLIDSEIDKLFNSYKPDIVQLSHSLRWWDILPVYDKTSDEEFFSNLRRGYFNVNMYLRTEKELEYLPLRDLFHDTVGHLPILQSENYTNYLRTLSYLYWLAGSNKNEKFLKELISRVYWVTSEFGLIHNGHNAHLAYGAGIVSSVAELKFATSTNARVFHLDGLFVTRLMDLQMEYEKFQNEYLVINSFTDLEKILKIIISQFTK